MVKWMLTATTLALMVGPGCAHGRAAGSLDKESSHAESNKPVPNDKNHNGVPDDQERPAPNP